MSRVLKQIQVLDLGFKFKRYFEATEGANEPFSWRFLLPKAEGGQRSQLGTLAGMIPKSESTKRTAKAQAAVTDDQLLGRKNPSNV